MTGHTVSAPGKAFLCGEYAVIDGSPAVVAAVDRRVFVGWNEGASDRRPLGPEVLASLELANDEFGHTRGSPRIDRGALYQEDKKLGLGSSAAASVAVAGAVARQRGHDLSDPRVRRRVFATAFEGHRSVAPDGSGADVAVATYGGFIDFETQDHNVSVRSIDPPDGLVLSLVWTGSPARTSELLSQVRRLQASAPREYERSMGSLRRGADTFAKAFSEGDTRALIATIRLYHDAMRTLGETANAPIVDASLQRIAAEAVQAGGAAKPCGAGGGDVAIALFEDRNAAERFEAACRTAGFQPIAIRWGAQGVETRSPLLNALTAAP